ncbi:hypothetical protein [Nostoc sp.]
MVQIHDFCCNGGFTSASDRIALSLREAPPKSPRSRSVLNPFIHPQLVENSF